jgi:cytoskeleton protein RodZ
MNLTPGGMDVQEIGEILQAKRKEKGLSLEEIEQATKIRMRYLAAIEAGDLSALPGMVYARGFIKSYADYLGLDGHALLEQYGTESQASDSEPQAEKSSSTAAPSPAGTKKSNLWSQMAMGLGVLGIMMIVYLVVAHRSNPQPAPTPPQTPATQQKTADVQTVPPTGTAAKPDADHQKESVKQTPLEAVSKKQGHSFYQVKGDDITLQVSATRGNNWLQVVADGKVIASETLPQGSSRTYHATSQLDLITGNSPAIDVTVNGQPVTLEQVSGRYEFHFRQG